MPPPSRSGLLAVANRLPSYSQLNEPAPNLLLYWESIRDRAIESGDHSLGRMASTLAEAHRLAYSRLVAEGDVTPEQN
jgi:hypothetical protein